MMTMRKTDSGLMSEFQKKRDKRNAAIVDEWHRLTDGSVKRSGARTAAVDLLARKYGLYSRAAVYKIIKNANS